MKILIASDSYPPRLGGTPRHVGSLSEELSRRGHQVSVCTMASRCRPRLTKDNEPRVHELSGLFPRVPFLYRTSKRYPPPTPDPILVRQLRGIIQKEKPDIAHAHGSIVQSLIPALKHFDVPLVLTLHTYIAICPAAGMVKETSGCNLSLGRHCIACSRQLYGFGPLGIAKSLAMYFAIKKNRNKLSSVSKFIAVSSYVRQVHLQNLNLRDDDIVVIPNFYARDTSERAQKTGELPERYILFVGRLVSEKGVDILIDAYRRLNTETKLVLIGAKEPAYHYKSAGNIMVIENAPYSLITEAYQNCRFAIFPSIWPDPCPTAVFEAMSYKKAIITSSAGGFTDAVLDGETGILVPPNEAEALANAMNYLLENPQVADKMGQKGYERWRQNFTDKVVVSKIEKLYHSLL